MTILGPNQTLADIFTYEIEDGDGDTSTTTLTINIVGVPAVIGLNDGLVANTDGSVLESDLSSGTNAAGNGEILNGSFQIVSPVNGVGSISVAGTSITLAQLNAIGVTLSLIHI